MQSDGSIGAGQKNPGLENSAQEVFRHATGNYLLALGLVGALAVGCYLLMEPPLHRQAGFAPSIDMAGKQRMLSQRIAGLSLQVSQPGISLADRTEREAALARSIDEMEAAHRALTLGSPEARVPEPGDETLRALYFTAPGGIDERVKQFLANARALLASSPESRAGARAVRDLLAEAGGPLLDGLEAATRQYVQESEDSLLRFRLEAGGALMLMLLALGAEALFIFHPLFQRLAVAHNTLLEAARTDPLTGCMNRRFLAETAEREMARSRRNLHKLSAMVLDIDHFKQINDRHGHAAGDMAITAVVSTLLNVIRTTDMLGRIGGEEFAVLMPDTALPGALIVADRARARVEAIELEVGGTTIRMTISIGVTEIVAQDESFTAALSRADQALYEAKHAGRNRVRVAEAAPVSEPA